MASCYILYSATADKFYIGYTKDTVECRLEKHISVLFKRAFTSRATDWQVFLVIECKSLSQAKLIEKHIKKMKSRKYINSLKQYPDMVQKLLQRFQ